MNDIQFQPESPRNIVLAKVTEGMEVIDRQGDGIGTVEFVQLGAQENAGVGAATPEGSGDINQNLFENAIEAIVTVDDIPEELREHLLQQGFIRVNSSRLFAADRYILPDNIDRVADGKVYLNENYDDLIKRR